MIFGLIFSAVGFGIMYFSVTAARRKKAAEENWTKQTDGGKEIWLARPDWAAGKIKSLTGAQVKVFAFMALMFCGIGAMYVFAALPKELHKGNNKAWIVLVFPAIGIGFVIAIIRAMLARRRFGDCFFELAQVPAPLGGSLDGLIETVKPLKLEEDLRLKLSCLRRTVSGSGKNRSVQENILWQDEKVFRADASLPTTGVGGSGIPVHFKLPANQPESSLRGSSTIIWRLEAKAKMVGPDFAAVFEVPVFHVAGTVASLEKDFDSTKPLQLSVEEIRRDEHSRIRVANGIAGREFYFPAARNIVTTLYLTLMFLIWTGFTLAAYFLFKSLLFEIVSTALDVLIFFTCFNLWLKSSLITIDTNTIRARNRWLIFSRSKNFTAGDIRSIELKLAFNVGSHAFYSLQLVLPSGKSTIIATGLPDKLEAEWLVQEMNKALGRRA